jgi:UDP-N-acetylmuramyl pentapeptide phosphotransferase/UDP-N-acetylglucosamine-1-phosphate transferase
MIFYATLALSIFLVALLGTRLVILSQRKRASYMDIPKLRGPSVRRIPSGGGFAVMMAIIIGLAVADISYAIILSVMLLMAVSLLHDVIGVPFFVRLIVQIMAVMIALAIFPHPFFDASLPPVIDKVLAGAAWLWFIHLFDDMDQIDGLSAVEMISIGLGCAMIAIFLGAFPTPLSTYGIVIAAAGCGFLWWSWHPTHITLGAVGRVPIGFLLGYLLAITTASGYYYAAAILPAYYLADGFLTWAMRNRPRHAVDGSHNSSYFMLATLRGGRSHHAVASYVAGANILLGGLAIYSVLFPHLAIYTLLAGYIAVGLLLAFFAYTKHNPQHELF